MGKEVDEALRHARRYSHHGQPVEPWVLPVTFTVLILSIWGLVREYEQLRWPRIPRRWWAEPGAPRPEPEDVVREVARARKPVVLIGSPVLEWEALRSWTPKRLAESVKRFPKVAELPQWGGSGAARSSPPSLSRGTSSPWPAST